MNDITITAIGSACAAFFAAALFIVVPAVDAAETVHTPVRGDTQDAAAESAPRGAGKRPDVQPDPIGKSARPDVAPEPGPATTGIEHEDIGSKSRTREKAKMKTRRGKPAFSVKPDDKLSTVDEQADATAAESSATGRARAAEKGGPKRR